MLSNWNNIPAELRCLQQWVVSDSDKIPKNPKTRQAADVTDPTTWGSFEDATKAGFKNIGFVLTDQDPYTIIDLDNKPDHPLTQEQYNKHQSILEMFPSYTEKSVSGLGYHIIIKGKAPAAVKRDGVEIYSTARYMICTGNTVRQTTIQDLQGTLNLLFEKVPGMTAKKAELDESDYEILSDSDIFEMAISAENKEKFDKLTKGEWESMTREDGTPLYPSQSEADFALLTILAFYTRDNEQVRRIFRCSPLGKRDKAIKDDRYINLCLSKIRGVQADTLASTKAIEIKAEQVARDSTPKTNGANGKQTTATLQGYDNLPHDPVIPPPGLVGRIADYIYRTSPRPVYDVALAGAIGLVAGIAGRAYNISDTGLNYYLILLGKTGIGKEGAAQGIDRLLNAVANPPQGYQDPQGQAIFMRPTARDFLGPSHFASGQGLLRRVDKNPCFVAILGEFGYTMQQLSDPNASSPQMMLKKCLLDLYTKSGRHQTVREVAYSDQEKNTKAVQAPAVSILAESTPHTFFDGLTSEMVESGLVPRFSIIEYRGDRPEFNDNYGAFPDAELVSWLGQLVDIGSLANMNSDKVGCPVSIDNEADDLLRQFGKECDNRINDAGLEVEIQLWNRAHLKALKLCGILAVGVNHYSPVVTKDIAEWSIKFIKRDVSTMAGHFASGHVGRDDSSQEKAMMKIIRDYIKMPGDKLKGYPSGKVEWQKAGIIPRAYIQNRTQGLSAFKHDKYGAVAAADRVMKHLTQNGTVALIREIDAWQKFKSRAVLYYILEI